MKLVLEAEVEIGRERDECKLSLKQVRTLSGAYSLYRRVEQLLSLTMKT
jgi:hypothetical protein